MLLAALALLPPAAAPSRADAGPGARPTATSPPGTPARLPAAGPTSAPGGAKGRTFTLLYGDNHVFGVLPPVGWVLDDSSGLGAKIRTVLYPEGTSWKDAATVMYVNPIHQDPKAPRTLSEMVDRDVAAFVKSSPHGKVTVAHSIRTGAGKTAEVRFFARAGGDPEEAVAYVDEPDLVMLLVVSSRTPEGLRGALQAFHDLVSSYQFVAANVRPPQ